MRRDLPSGTVTFLFTDIEESTRLLHELGAEAYADVLAEHRRVLREAFARHAGVEVDTQGDAFFVGFARASDALAAAEAGQRALEGRPVRVRMGVHTGEPSLTGEGYVGVDVHLAARVMSAGHGGQILVSEATARLVKSVPLGELGHHRLKDLSEPLRLYQLGEGEFPPLRALHQTNLPIQPSPLVGRERELAELGPLVCSHRVVTLTGAGGSGKTRLALQVAADSADVFPEGVYWVALQALSDPGLVVPAIERALDADRDLVEYVGDKRLLLLLDNFEQVSAAAKELGELLLRMPRAAALVTSREPLRLPGEQRYPVEPLVPEDAEMLFAQAARLVEPRFEATAAVGEICRRLDGLPLAIELAAARASMLSPDALLERLDRRLPLLTGGSSAAPERQRTLRATIDWSHALLDGDEQRLFRRLSVFAGSFDLAGAETICGADLDTLQSLVDRSLVRRWGSGRFGFLETIREYAAERLEEVAEAQELQRTHADHFVAFAERVEPELDGREQGRWLDLLEAEHDNLRGALTWGLEHPATGVGLRLAAGLGRFWYKRSYFSEGRRWLDAALSADSQPPALRLKALAAAGTLAHFADDQTAAEKLFRDAAALADELADDVQLGFALNGLGMVVDELDDVEESARIHERSLALFRRSDHERGVRTALSNLAERALRLGDLERAHLLLEESIALSRRADDVFSLTASLDTLGAVALAAGDASGAAALYRELLQVAYGNGFSRTGAYGFAGLAAAAGLEGDVARAGRLWGSFERAEDELGIRILESERVRYERLVLAAADGDPKRFAAARAAGRALVTSDALAEAVADA